jgi:hypothetical protein
MTSKSNTCNVRSFARTEKEESPKVKTGSSFINKNIKIEMKIAHLWHGHVYVKADLSPYDVAFSTDAST